MSKQYRSLVNIVSDGTSNFDQSILLSPVFKNSIKANCESTLLVSSVEIPRSWYMLDETTTNSILVNKVTVNITHRKNYNKSELAVELERNLSKSGIRKKFAVTYDAASNKYYIESSDDFNIDFRGSALLAKYFGFLEKEYEAKFVTSSTGTVYVLNSVNVSNIERYDGLTICSSLAHNNYCNDICYIYVKSSMRDDMIVYNDNGNQNMVTLDNNLNDNNIYNFKLIDTATRKEINLNNAKWRMTLRLTVDSGR